MKTGIILVLMALGAALARFATDRQADRRDSASSFVDEQWQKKLEGALKDKEQLLAFSCVSSKGDTYMAVTDRRVFFMGEDMDGFALSEIEWVRFQEARGYDARPEFATYMTLCTPQGKKKVFKTSGRFVEVCKALQDRGVRVKKSFL